MDKKVFISKGSASTAQQRAFIEAVLSSLKMTGLIPRIMGETEWSHEQPLKAIKDVVKDCDGAVIIAFTRTKFEKGIEVKGDKSLEISNIALPTTWNHIEGALAYSLDMPLLVIAEEGLKEEGLIDKGYDWKVYWTTLSPEVVNSDSFRGVVASWKTAVEKYKAQPSPKQEPIDPEKLPLGKILNSLTTRQVFGILTAIAVLAAGIATLSFKVGKYVAKNEPKATTSSHP